MVNGVPLPDQAVIRVHLGQLFDRCLIEYPGGLCEIAWSDSGRWAITNAQSFPATPEGLDAAAELAARISAARSNVYVGANPRKPNAPERGRCSAEHVEIAFFQFIECDKAESVELIGRAALPPSFITVTGRAPSVREHCYWPLPKAERDLRSWARRQGVLGNFFHGDTMIDPPRLLRLAGTVNYPRPDKAEKGYQTEFVTLQLGDEYRVFTPEELQRTYANGATDENTKERAGDGGPNFGHEQDTVNAWFAAIDANDGRWHNSVRDLVAHLVARGYDQRIIQALAPRLTLPGFTVAQTLAELNEFIRGARAKGFGPDTTADDWDAAGAPGGPVETATGKGYTMEKIDWLWRGWLARGKFHLLAGAKGAGKSTICFDLMARITVGSQWPDGTPAPIGDVLVWSGEDGIADTILPRFVVAGGDRSRIHFIKSVLDKGVRRPFDPAVDMPKLLVAAEKIPELRLMLIDPIVQALPVRTDSHKNSETRRGLQPVVDFAERRNAALIGITHFTKGTEDKQPVERVTGSLAFGALARIVLGASADEDGRQRRMVRIASNIGPDGGGIEYTLFEAPIPGEDNFLAQRVDWGARLTGTARELLDATKKSAEAEAIGFLKEFLCGGPQPQREVKAAAEAYGHSWATVRRAQLKLGIKPRKEGTIWVWQPPEARGASWGAV